MKTDSAMIADGYDFGYYYRFKKIEDNFEDLWKMKSTTRESLRSWLQIIHLSARKANSIANAASELVENCIKYSEEDTYSYITIGVNRNTVVIKTRNTCDKKQCSGAKAYIRDLNAKTGSITETYLNKIRESKETGKSQLGLIRIIMETGGSLEAADDNDPTTLDLTVTINA